MDKAAKDPKVQKAIKKKSAAGKSKAKGGGNAVGAKVENGPESQGGGEGESTQDAKGKGGENPEAPEPESVDDQWKAKDPITDQKNILLFKLVFSNTDRIKS